jgi:hypothetical protein
VTYQPLGKKGAEDRLTKAKKVRAHYEPEWYMNLAFYQGEQWVAWNGESIYKPRMDGRIQITDNRIAPAVTTSVAQLTKMRPAWDALPTDGSDKAVQDAITGERLVDWAYDHYDLAGMRTEAITWARVACAGFIKSTWDPTLKAGTNVLVAPDGAPIRLNGEIVRAGEAPELEQMDGVEVKQIGGGDLAFSVRSPFDIYPDPLATRLGDCRYIIDATVRSPEYVSARYGKDVSPDAPPQTGILEQRYAGLSVNIHQDSERTGVKVYELWEIPSRECPQGRRVVWCDQGLLYEGPNEYARLPYVMFESSPVPGRFWPRSPVSDMRPIQVQRNKLISQIAANMARFGNAALIMDQLAQQKYHGVPGEQIIVSMGQSEPKYLVPPGVPPQMFQLLDATDASLREISGQYEIAQGSVPSGVTAASAISLLAEQNNTRLGPTIESMERSIGDWGQQTLDLVAKYFTFERIVSIVGDDGIIEIDSFRANADYNTPTVRVRSGSTFPQMLATKQSAIRDTLNLMLQYGVPISGPEVARALRDMQVGGLERLVQSQLVDIQQATREQADFMRGNLPSVREFDNDEVHLGVHRDFAKSQRFETLSDEEQGAFVGHIREHEAQQTLKMYSQQVGFAGTPQAALPTDPSGNPAPMQEPAQLPQPS